MEYILENDVIRLTVSDDGAQMLSLVRKDNGLEYLWQRDARFWNRTAPVLFPLVGRVLNDEYVFEGQTYKLGQHGFARDMKFELVEQKEQEIVFVLKDNEKSHEVFPFAFALTISYLIDDDEVKVNWKVDNVDNKEIFFSLGGHPAFNCPILPETKQEDYRVEVDAQDNFILYNAFENGFVIDDYRKFELVNKQFAIDEHTFDNDALVIEADKKTMEGQIHKVSLIDPQGKVYVTVTSDVPVFGIWSPPKKNAPFVCIEPWYGRCDSWNYKGDWSGREWGNRLGAGEIFLGGYTIKVE